jgi:mRNA interferase MazF
MKRGEIWFANLNPTQGSEQAGIRPVLIIQNDRINAYTTTILAIPLTTTLRRGLLPSCVQINKGEGGLTSDSVALCHQTRALDKSRLLNRLGSVSDQTLTAVENCILFTFGVTI